MPELSKQQFQLIIKNVQPKKPESMNFSAITLN